MMHLRTCQHCGEGLLVIPLAEIIGFARKNGMLSLLAVAYATRARVGPDPWVTLCGGCGCILDADAVLDRHSH